MSFEQALRDAAEEGVGVPRTPYSLRLDGVGPAPRRHRRIDWSFRDRTGETDRVASSTQVAEGVAADAGWRAAQLDAAYAYKRHLGRWHRVTAADGVLLVGDHGRLRTDRDSWAAYLNQFADDTPEGVADDPDGWVPCAVPMVDGLPLWVDDELNEALGAWSDVRVVGREIIAARD